MAAGMANPSASGTMQVASAAARAPPDSSMRDRRRDDGTSWKRARRRAMRSAASSTTTKASRIIESFAAATGSPMESHARKIPVVKVCTPK